MADIAALLEEARDVGVLICPIPSQLEDGDVVERMPDDLLRAATIIGQLCDALAAAEKERDELKHDVERYIEVSGDLATENEELRARREAEAKVIEAARKIHAAVQREQTDYPTGLSDRLRAQDELQTDLAALARLAPAGETP